jgi:hypothetical protein
MERPVLLSFQISDNLANKKNQQIETVLNRLGHVLPQSQPPQHDVFILNYYQISEPKLDQKSCPNFPAKDVAQNQVIHRLLCLPTKFAIIQVQQPMKALLALVQQHMCMTNQKKT